MQYFSYPWLLYFMSGSLWLLIPFIYFFHVAAPQSLAHVMYLWVCLFFWVFQFVSSFAFSISTYKWNRYKVFVFLWCFTWHRNWDSPVWSPMSRSYYFHGWVVFQCIYKPRLLCPFIHWWALGLLPRCGYCTQCCNQHGVHISLQVSVFMFFGEIPSTELEWPNSTLLF